MGPEAGSSEPGPQGACPLTAVLGVVAHPNPPTRNLNLSFPTSSPHAPSLREGKAGWPQESGAMPEVLGAMPWGGPPGQEQQTPRPLLESARPGEMGVRVLPWRGCCGGHRAISGPGLPPGAQPSSSLVGCGTRMPQHGCPHSELRRRGHRGAVRPPSFRGSCHQRPHSGPPVAMLHVPHPVPCLPCQHPQP